MVENLFFPKLIPMMSSEKVGALDKNLSEQSAKSFPSNFLHLHTLLSGHFSLRPPKMHDNNKIRFIMQYLTSMTVK